VWYIQLLGIVPTDAVIEKRLGEMFDCLSVVYSYISLCVVYTVCGLMSIGTFSCWELFRLMLSLRRDLVKCLTPTETKLKLSLTSTM